MKDEALKLALEALEFFKGISLSMNEIERAEQAITAIKQALAAPVQPEQEPVAWVSAVTGDVTTQDMSHTVSWVPLTTPPAAAQPTNQCGETCERAKLCATCGGVLAQPEQEPVCDKDPQGCWNVRCQLGDKCKNTPPAAQPAVPDFKAFKAWANDAGYDTAYTNDGVNWICLNPMTADLWKAWQAAQTNDPFDRKQIRDERFAALAQAAERSRQHDEIERLTNLCYEYLGELTALRAVKQTQDMMRDALTIGSAWVRDGKRLEPTSVYKGMEDT